MENIVVQLGFAPLMSDPKNFKQYTLTAINGPDIEIRFNKEKSGGTPPRVVTLQQCLNAIVNHEEGHRFSGEELGKFIFGEAASNHAGGFVGVVLREIGILQLVPKTEHEQHDRFVATPNYELVCERYLEKARFVLGRKPSEQDTP